MLFLSGAALLFAASAAATLAWCLSMAAMAGTPMPGGWTLSMAWTPMCGQTWGAAAASFVGMWVAMMAAMMLPSLVPLLWHGRESAGGGAGQARLDGLAGLAGAGYFLVWTVLGLAVFAAGAALADMALRLPALARAVPVAQGVTLLLAGALQFTAWKARHLARCRDASGCGRRWPAGAAAAWRHGLRLGLHCGCSCAGLTAVLLAMGVMDLRAMVLVMAAVTAERLAPDGRRVARAIGAVVMGAGLVLVVRAAFG